MKGLNNPIGYKSNQTLQNPFIMNPFRFSAGGGAGSWKELDRTTLVATGDSITVSGLPNKEYYMVLTSKLGTANSGCWLQLNSDTGSNYAYRMSNNGGADGTVGSTTNGGAGTSATGNPAFGVRHISNLASKEKLTISEFTEQNLPLDPPQRRHNVAKWSNTSNAVDTITELNIDSGDLSIGSETVVLGWDSTDTYTTTDNFWQELGSSDLSGGTADILNITSFSAKKYLWIQYYIEESTANANARLTFNNDTGTNYAYRRSLNGGTDSTGHSKSYISPDGFEAGNKLVNMFIINKSANEKLSISNSVTNATAGAGASPTRCKMVFKWTNTSSQITRIDLTNADTGEMGTESFVKVWGSN